MTESEEVQQPQVIPEQVEDPVQKMQLELTDYKDKYFRALAEIENTRKRLQREKIESQSYAVQNIVCDLLQPLDHFEQALKHAENASPEIRNWAIGFEMMLSQFKQILGDHGVTTFNAKGELFDPHQHEAIETEETTQYLPGVIMEEFVRGYKLGNRVIRPARVKVATAPIPTDGQGQSAEINVEQENLDVNGQK